MGGVQNTRGNSGGVGGLFLWSKNGNSGVEGGSYMYVKFPPWWGYGYFLEPHITQHEVPVINTSEATKKVE